MKLRTFSGIALTVISSWLPAVSPVVECRSQTAETYRLPADAWTRKGDPVLKAGTLYSDGRVRTAIADPDVHFDASKGRLHLYYQTGLAWNYTDGNPKTVIQHAVSQDGGETWTLDAGFALTPPTDTRAWDANWVETPTVVYDPTAPADRRYKMYYTGAAKMHALGFPDYSIGLAISGDGVNFRRLPARESPYRQAGAVLKVKKALPHVKGLYGGIVADPEVKRIGNVYHLWFSSFAHDSENRPLAFGISHATSPDGIRWTPSANNPMPALRNASGGGGQQPTVDWNPATNSWEMYFTSDTEDEKLAIPSTFNPSLGLWRATSKDGFNWSIDYSRPRDFYWKPDAPNEAYGLLTGADSVIVGNNRLIFYTGWGYLNVPSSFLVPTRDGYESAVLNLFRAARPTSN